MSGLFRMLTSIASSDGWSYQSGQVVRPGDHYGPDTVLEATLRGWVAGGIAEPVALPSRIPETAVLPAPEAAVMPSPAPRGPVPEDTTAPKRRKNRR